MKKDTDALRRLKKGRAGGGGASAFSSLFGSSAASAASRNDDASSGQESEDEKVKAQMRADVEALAKDAKGLGIEVEESMALKALRAVVDDWTK